MVFLIEDFFLHGTRMILEGFGILITSCGQVKTQLIEYDYSKMEEEGDIGDENGTRYDEPIQPVEPYESSTTTTSPTTTGAPLSEYDDYTTTASPDSSTTTNLPGDGSQSTTTAWWGSEEASTTISPESEIIAETEYTQDAPESSHTFEEPVHENAEGEMEAGWGWFGTSEATPTEEPSVTSTPKPNKKTRRRRRKKTRRNRTKKSKKRLGSMSPVGRHDGITQRVAICDSQLTS